MTDSPNPVLIFGNGQLGRALADVFAGDCVVVSRSEIDFAIANEAQFASLIAEVRPRAIFNAIAFTAVDLAEGEGRALAFQINADAVGALAQAAAHADIPLIHYSTDYVFDGSGQHAWQESDATHPLNVYGASKLSGEHHAINAGGQYLLFRISWVFDEFGKNFMNTMFRLGSERAELKVVNDQIGAPCYAPDIAEASKSALVLALEMPQFPSGIYHMAAGGETSWHGFAESIFHHAAALGRAFQLKTLIPIATSEYPTPATRPLNSRLNCEKLQSTFNITMPSWQSGLARCLRNKFQSAI